MSQSPHLDGPALRALAAGGGRGSFLPPALAAPAEKPRDRIWELSETLHCSIVGTCLTTADGRSLLAKLGVPDARTMSEHRLHGQVVHLAGRKDGGGKLLQKMLDRRHEAEVRRFERAGTAAEVRALWQDSLARGDIPGAYWAAMTHPATDWTLVQDIFGEVHMLSHLVGQSNRADIRRLRQLEADLGERAETIAAQELRIHDLMAQRDALGARHRALSAAQAIDAASRPVRPTMEGAAELAQRLAREQAHAEALEEKVAVLTRACARLSADLEAETARRTAAEGELETLEAVLSSDPGDPPEAVTDAGLADRVLLYVGGRPRQVATLRRLTIARGGQLLSHDGGLEESLSLLPGLISRSDLILFPVDCVSHEATGLVKRWCEAAGKTFRPLRSASVASFVQATRPGPAAR